MKRILIIFAILSAVVFCAPAMWGAAISAAGSGNWNSTTPNAPWPSGTVPVSTDDVTIGNGFTVHVTDTQAAKTITTAGVGASGTGCGGGATPGGTACNLYVDSGGQLTVNQGTSGSVTTAGTGGMDCLSGSTCIIGSSNTTSNTIDITVGAGTMFKIENGALFTMKGSITQAQTSAVYLNGHTVCTPPTTATAYRITNTANSLSDVTTLAFIGGDYVSNYAVFETASTQTLDGGHCSISNNSQGIPKIVIQNAILNSLGDKSNPAITESVASVAPQTLTVNNVMFLNDGLSTFATDAGVSNAATFSWNHVDFRHPSINANANFLVFTSPNNTQPTAGTRTMYNITADCYNTVGNWQNGAGWVVVGSSSLNGGADTAGWYSLDCLASGATYGNLTYTNFWINAQAAGGGNWLSFPAQENNVMQYGVFYGHGDNIHLASASVIGALAANVIQYTFSDFDNYYGTDQGELCHGAGIQTCRFNIAVNGGPNLENSQGSNQITIRNNTWRNSGSIGAGETIVNALEIAEVHNNIFDHPDYQFSASQFPNCMTYESGFAQQASFITQTNNLDGNNVWYGFPNTTDDNARSCANSNTYSPFIGIYALGGGDVRNSLSAKVATNITTTTLTYSAGGFTSGTGDNLVGVNDVVWDASKKTWALVASTPTLDTVLTMDRVTSPAMATGDSFSILKRIWADGSGIGLVANRGLTDFHANPSFFYPDAGVIRWYNLMTGNSLVPPTQIGNDTVNPGGNANWLQIGRDIIKLNGWDYGSASSLAGTNCSANCPAHVTPIANLTATNMLQKAYIWYRPYSGMLSHAGDDGRDIGALPVYPAAINSN